MRWHAGQGHRGDRERRPHGRHRRRRARRRRRTWCRWPACAASWHSTSHGDPPYVRALAGTTLRELQAPARHPRARLDAAARSHRGRRVAWAGWSRPTPPARARFRFGATRDWVVGLTVELASGPHPRAAPRHATAPRATRVTLVGRRRPPHRAPAGHPQAAHQELHRLRLRARRRRARPVRRQRGHARRRQRGDVPADRRPSSRGSPSCSASPRRRRRSPWSRPCAGTTRCAPPPSSSSTPARTSWPARPASRRWRACWPTRRPGSCSVFAEFGYDDEAGLEATIERVLAHVAAAGGDEAAGLAGIDDQVLRDIRVFRHAVPERINATIARRREQHPTLHKIATDMAVEDKDLRWVYDLYTTRLTDGRARPRDLRPRRQQPLPRQHPAAGTTPNCSAPRRSTRSSPRPSSPAAAASPPSTASGGSRSTSCRCSTARRRSTRCGPPSGGSIREWRLNPGVLIDP